MPNSVQYSETAVDNALGVGNIYVGVPAKGPTSVSGFYGGINPPSGGYTIYLNKQEGGPSIYTCANDADLISQTSAIAGESVPTVSLCLAYFAGQSDKIVIFNPINTLDTNDLTLYLNAAPLPSYPRSGDTCYDLSTDSNNADFYNGATFDSNSETMDFDGVNDYILTENNVTITGDQSIETTIKFDSLEGFLQGLVSNHDYVNTSNFGINQVRSNKIGISIGYTNGTREYQDKYSTTSVVTGRFYHIVMTFNLSANQCKLYIDGELDSTFNLTKTVKYTSRPMVLGRWDYQYTNYYFDGEISQAKYYSKTLSAEEVNLNYYQGQITANNLVFAADASNKVSFFNSVPANTTTYSLTGSDTGTLTNGVAFSSGNGGTWDFDGVDDYIVLDNNLVSAVGGVGTSTEYTLEAWIYVRTSSGTTTNADNIIGHTSSTGFGMQVGTINSKPRINYGARSTSNFYSSTFEYNEWVHVVLSRSSTQPKCQTYLNGVLDVSASNNLNISSPADGNLTIGGGGGRVSGYFDGLMGPVRVYSTALTAEEVAQNYNAYVNKFN